MKERFLKPYIFILLLTVFAFVLRIYAIWSIPPSLSWDEVSIGYNAYSILKTGRDEHGRFFPLDTFIAYGDYKPPLPVYITVPFVAVFGLNELAVRLPSALFGTLTILFTYFLVKELFKQRQMTVINGQDSSYDYRPMSKEVMPLLSALLLALSPWHINLSRAGFEANIALFFIAFGVYLVLRAYRNPKTWIIAWIPFVAAVYTFNSSRYFAPFLAVGLLLLGWKSIKHQFRFFALGICVAFILLVPILPHILSKEARLRYAEVNIFSDPSIVVTANRRIEESGNAWWAKLVFNRRVGYARSYVLHFLDHFQPDFLFIKGDGNPKFSIQDVGQLYAIEAPFLVIGIVGMLLVYPSIALFLLYWMLASIIPAAVARETPHALRILNSLPTWQIFTAFGILVTMSYALRVTSYGGRKILVKGIMCSVIIILYGLSVIYYLHNYYIHYPKEFSGEWQYGYKQAIEYVQALEKSYDTIYMTESIGRPYMYTLFYTRMDPNEIIRTKNASFDDAGFYHVYGIGMYKFVKDMPESCIGSCLYIDQAGAPVGEVSILKTIHLLNGVPILKIYEK